MSKTYHCCYCMQRLADTDLYQGRLLLGDCIDFQKAIVDPDSTIFCCGGTKADRCERKAIKHMDAQYGIAWAWSHIKHLPCGFPWMDSFVYFITDGDAIKIGTTKNVKHRLGILQIGNPRKLTCLKQIPGDIEDASILEVTSSMPSLHLTESLIHQRLSEYKIQGEWYEYCSELKRLIDGTERLIREYQDWRSKIYG